MSGDLLFSTIQVPQGNLKMMMHILINLAGALCAYTSVGRSESAWRVGCIALVREMLSSRSPAQRARAHPAAPTAIVSLV